MLGQLLDRLAPWRRKPRSEKEALTLPPMTRGMQAFSMVLFFVLGTALTWFVVANPFDVAFLQQRGPQATTSTGPRDSEASAAGTVYQCPMHPQVVQDHPADCPICEMTLIEVKETATASEREILYWYAPMDATYIRDEPGLSPMGMKLVPKYADQGAGSAEGVIRIDPIQVQNIGVVSTKAELTDIARTSRTVGILDFDPEGITWINTKFEGWIEKVRVTYVGDEVEKGQALFEIYAPELVTTQEEYLRALDYRASLEGSDRPGARRQAETCTRPGTRGNASARGAGSNPRRTRSGFARYTGSS